MRLKIIPLTAATLAALSAGGCLATLPLETIGTLAGITASAVSTGGDVYKLGKLDTAEMCRLVDATEAVRNAADDLSLHLRRDTVRDDGVAEFFLVDDHDQQIDVHVNPRTESLMLLRIDVGLFGSEVTARLILARIRAHLPTPMPPAVEKPE